MTTFFNIRNKRWLPIAALLVCWSSLSAAQVTLLVEEPFGHFGAFTATGHAAIYLERVCAVSPTILRRCEAGETGIVISRYNKGGGRDWIAIPLMPYLYAVDSPDDIPLFVDPKVVAFLRNEYRRKRLEDVAPDQPDGEPPDGNWVQLVGSAYDRTIYGFKIETSEEQDNEFIREYNASPNQPRFNLLAHNCADFARGIIDFYHPKAVRRNVVADFGITTPKQLAKSLTKYSKRHPDLEFSTFVIPQIPGVIERSTTIHGVLESLLKSKKYLLPLAALHPVVAGCAAAVYLGDGRFDTGRNAMILDPEQGLQPRLTASQRLLYREQLDSLLAEVNPELRGLTEKRAWASLASEPELDPSGGPALRIRSEGQSVEMGLARDNVAESGGSKVLSEELLTARLLEELHGSAAVSQNAVANDWELLRNMIASAGKPSSACDGRSGTACTARSIGEDRLNGKTTAANLR